MKVVFKNPITSALEVGVVVKKYMVNKLPKFDVISEKGTYFTALSKNNKKIGYIDENLTKKFSNFIDTNLTKESQANYKNKEYIPKILKIEL